LVRYKALLIGVAQYEAAGISSLPFVPDDLERMATALKARGFHQVQLVQAPMVSTNVIKGEVSGFLAEAKQNDRLLVVLSGHGVHSEGKDYLVPQDFHPNKLSPSEGCVEIDWRLNLQRADFRAEQVAFLIDACREGVRDDDTMGTERWSDRKIATVQRSRIAYVYACSQAQVARYVRETDAVRDGHEVDTQPGDTFSLFSRTVTDLLSGPVSTLGEFGPAAQERIDALHTAYGKRGPAQQVRVLTEEDHDDFTLFPPAETTAGLAGAERTWADAVTNHPAWNHTAPLRAGSVESLKEVCVRLVGRYARACAAAEPKIADDPWYDHELAERTAERLGFLLLRLADGTELSPTEAALLAVLPFAAQAHWAQHAARRDLSEAELDDVLTGYPRLGRRLRTLAQNPSRALSDIRWWGVHRWLVQHPEAFTHEFLICEEPGARAPSWALSELSAPRLLAHLKEQRVAPAAVPGTARTTALREERQVAPSTSHEHTVRERLVSALLKGAHALAIDPADLPEVLVEHLGISDSVSLDDLRSTLRQSHWAAAGAGRSLNAECDHPAIELALKRHAETVDALLRDISKEAARPGSSLSPLTALPAYADAQQVRPSGAAPAELSSGIRFRLADDRVQELLMGEQLYGDRALAIRELYQNALDALRYRTARTEYLRRSGKAVPDWEGEIVFTEGVDSDDRPYLECADNGVGMGVTELSRAFAQGGSRFVDLPEYREEGALWASLDPPVELVPVSRFGLGVLSYFMIADELAVWTCRLDREGRPGKLLKVTIAGPGNLFRVEDLGAGREAGTRVRLYGAPGKPIPSSGVELERCLWVSPYVVRAPKRGRVLRWEPKSLAAPREEGAPGGMSCGPARDRDRFGWDTRSMPYIWSNELRAVSMGTTPKRPASAAKSHQKGVWWTDGDGAVVVDGIANDTTLFGRVVDLHGTDQATLSVDRKKLSWYDAVLVRNRSLAAVEDLIDAADLLSPAWLNTLQRQDLELADAIAARAAEKGVSWTSWDWTLDTSRTGFFPPDLLLLPAVTGSFPWPHGPHDIVAALLILCMPDHVLRWRLTALHPELPMGALQAAKPSDLLLLTKRHSRAWDDSLKRAMDVYAKNHSREERGRAGYSSGEMIYRHEITPWRSTESRVSVPELLATAARHWRAPVQVAERLRALGFSVDALGPLQDASADDLALLAPYRDIRAQRLDSVSPDEFVLPGNGVHLAHLYTQDHPRQAAYRLQKLGYVLPSRLVDGLVEHDRTAEQSRPLARALLRHSFGTVTSPEEADRVTKGQVLYAAACIGSSTASVTRTLTALGFVVPDPSTLPELTDRHQIAAAMIDRGPYRSRDFDKVMSFGRELGREMLLMDVASMQEAKDFGFPSPDAARTAAGSAPPGDAEAARADSIYRRVSNELMNKNVNDPAGSTVGLLILCYERETLRGRNEIEGRHATLAEIASAALRLRRPFREVAARATELGFRHEAESWWPDGS
jgi:hypothetical protein